MNAGPAVYLLSIPGKLAPTSVEAARLIHNDTAGAPASVAAARSLGDLSHMVYVSANGGGPGDFLILDLWNNLDGLNQFFANHQVQEQAGLIFSQRDPRVWEPAEGFAGYHFPVPYGKNDRFVGFVHGSVRSRAEAQAIHNSLVEAAINQSRLHGSVSHEAYFLLTPPGVPESLEFCAVDVWMDAAGMAGLYQDPEFLRGAQAMFAGAPSMSAWTHPAGSWVEW